MKLSKFRIVVLVLICILICAMIYVSLGVVNGTINPLLGLFTVLFLWGSWRVIFRSRGWTNRFQCLAFLLCMFIVCYGLAFYQSYINYEAWKQELIKQNPIHGTVYVTWRPFLDTKTGGHLMLAGFGLFGLWILLFAFSDKLKGKPELTTLEACSPPSP